MQSRVVSRLKHRNWRRRPRGLQWGILFVKMLKMLGLVCASLYLPAGQFKHHLWDQRIWNCQLGGVPTPGFCSNWVGGSICLPENKCFKLISTFHSQGSKTKFACLTWHGRIQCQFSTLCGSLFQAASDSTWQIAKLDIQSRDFSLRWVQKRLCVCTWRDSQPAWTIQNLRSCSPYKMQTVLRPRR